MSGMAHRCILNWLRERKLLSHHMEKWLEMGKEVSCSANIEADLIITIIIWMFLSIQVTVRTTYVTNNELNITLTG
jgi:hypothetical protein